MRIFLSLLVIFVLKIELLYPSITIELENITSEVSTFQRVPFFAIKLDFSDRNSTNYSSSHVIIDVCYAVLKNHMNPYYLIYLTSEILAAKSRQSPEIYGSVSKYFKATTQANDSTIYEAFLKMYSCIQLTDITVETIFANKNSCHQFVDTIITSFLPKLLQVMGADTDAITLTTLLESQSKLDISSSLFTVYKKSSDILEANNRRTTCCCLPRFCRLFR